MARVERGLDDREPLADQREAARGVLDREREVRADHRELEGRRAGDSARVVERALERRAGVRAGAGRLQGGADVVVEQRAGCALGVRQRLGERLHEREPLEHAAAAHAAAAQRALRPRAARVRLDRERVLARCEREQRRLGERRDRRRALGRRDPRDAREPERARGERRVAERAGAGGGAEDPRLDALLRPAQLELEGGQLQVERGDLGGVLRRRRGGRAHEQRRIGAALEVGELRGGGDRVGQAVGRRRGAHAHRRAERGAGAREAGRAAIEHRRRERGAPVRDAALAVDLAPAGAVRVEHAGEVLAGAPRVGAAERGEVRAQPGAGELAPHGRQLRRAAVARRALGALGAADAERGGAHAEHGGGDAAAAPARGRIARERREQALHRREAVDRPRRGAPAQDALEPARDRGCHGEEALAQGDAERVLIRRGRQRLRPSSARATCSAACRAPACVTSTAGLAPPSLPGCAAPAGPRARRERGRLAAAREAEVHDAHAVIGADERVLRLEVAVDQSGAVRGRQALARLAVGEDHVARAAGRGAVLAQRLPQDELHHDVDLIAVHAHVVDGHDVRVREPRERLALGEHAVALGRRARA